LAHGFRTFDVEVDVVQGLSFAVGTFVAAPLFDMLRLVRIAFASLHRGLAEDSLEASLYARQTTPSNCDEAFAMVSAMQSEIDRLSSEFTHLRSSEAKPTPELDRPRADSGGPGSEGALEPPSVAGRPGDGSMECLWFDDLTYHDCCRDQDANGLGVMADVCFDETYTYERCCTFWFGPVIRALPYRGTMEPKGFAILDFPALGREGQNPINRLRIQLADASDCEGCTGAHSIWMTAWYFGSLTTQLPKWVAESKGSWEAGHGILAPLLGHSLLRVLDLGTGVGTAAVAAAVVGHNVTAVDFDPRALDLGRRNARYHGVSRKLRFLKWDMLSPISAPLRDSMPFDVVFVEGSFLNPFVEAVGSPDIPGAKAALRVVIQNLEALDARVNVFMVYHPRGSGEATLKTRLLLSALQEAGEQRRITRPCGAAGRCVRSPEVSPKYWLEGAGLAPPTFHGMLLW